MSEPSCGQTIQEASARMLNLAHVSGERAEFRKIMSELSTRLSKVNNVIETIRITDNGCGCWFISTHNHEIQCTKYYRCGNCTAAREHAISILVE